MDLKTARANSMREKPAEQRRTSLDLDRLKELSDSIGAENMSAVLDLVLDTAPGTRDEFRAACADGDMPLAARKAHKLKSDCANLGAEGLLAELARFEKLVRAGESDGINAVLPELLSHIEQFLEDVRRERQRQ